MHKLGLILQFPYFVLDSQLQPDVSLEKLFSLEMPSLQQHSLALTC